MFDSYNALTSEDGKPEGFDFISSFLIAILALLGCGFAFMAFAWITEPPMYSIRLALDEQGYSHVQYTGRSWRCSGENFTAIGPTGKEVSGVACGEEAGIVVHFNYW